MSSRALLGAIFFFTLSAAAYAEPSWNDDLTITESAWAMQDSSIEAATKAGKAVTAAAVAEAASAHADLLTALGRAIGTEDALQAAHLARVAAINAEKDAKIAAIHANAAAGHSPAGATAVVATWEIEIKNASKDTTWKDVHFKTTYWAPSGTQVGEDLSGHTEYIAIPPGQVVSIKFMEFVHSQAKTSKIVIDGAVIKN